MAVNDDIVRVAYAFFVLAITAMIVGWIGSMIEIVRRSRRTMLFIRLRFAAYVLLQAGAAVILLGLEPLGPLRFALAALPAASAVGIVLIARHVHLPRHDAR